MSVLVGVPKRLDLVLYDWGSGRIRINVEDEGAGGLHDLTGYTSLLHAYDARSGGAKIMQLAEGDGLATNPAGYVDIAFDGAVIGPAGWRLAFYDLFLVDSGAERYAFCTGTIQVRPSVARF